MERLLMMVGLLSMLADRCKHIIHQLPDRNETELKFF